MAGFFALNRVSSSNNNPEDQQQHQQHNSENWFWYKNEDISYKGSSSFDLWQQQAELLQQQQQQNVYSSAARLGMASSRRSAINVVGGGDSSHSRSTFMMVRGGGMSCQDCGNQAKKDCAHMRCRTCCKSQGFECRTHVKSTWVPASKRREKQQQQLQLPGGETSRKKHRENPNSSSLACNRFPTNTSGFEVGNLPAEVSTQAVFRCFKVSGIDDTEDQFAYQASVNIGGHLFKGILYDQGPAAENTYTTGESSSGGGGNLIARGPVPVNTRSTTVPIIAATAADGVTACSSSTAFIDPSLYPTPFPTFMAAAGTQFFPIPRPFQS